MARPQLKWAAHPPIAYFLAWAFLVFTALLEIYFVAAGLTYNTLVFVTSVGIVQSSVIALIFQHLREEPQSVKAFPLGSLVMLIILVSAAVTSVLACTPYLG